MPVSGKGLAIRIGLILAITAGFFLFLALEANGTPIRPDLQKLLAEPPEAAPFAPARAGWQGPEMSASLSSPARALLEQSSAGPQVRDSLLAILVPDVRVLLLIGFTILRLRRLWQPTPRPAVPMRSAREEEPPAKAA